jgi:hypothetical protein
MFPGKCTTWLGNTFTQPLTKEQKERLKPLDAPTASTSATANWKTYSNNGLFFKYPPEAELNQAERVKDEFNEGGTEITVTYIRPGYNWPQTDISDGYVFSIAWGEVIGFGTVKEVSQKRYAQLKDSNAFPQMTALTETKIANQSAYCLEQGPVFYGRTCYAGNEGTIFEIDFFSSSSDVKQKQNYDLVLSQILSTFKFIDDTNKTVSPICNLKNANYGFKVAGYYKCNGYNLLIPDQIILDLPAIIVDDNANDILTCGGMPGPNGPNTCPEKYQRNESCKKIDCP